MKWLAAVLAVFVAGLLAWLAWTGRAARPAPLATSAAETPAASPASCAAVELGEANAPPESRELAVPPSVPQPTAVAPAPAAELLELRGTLVAIDEHGVEHPREDGGFALVLWKGPKGREQTVAVRAGSWTARVPREPGLHLGAQEIVLGGRGAALEDEAAYRPLQCALPEDGRLAWRARWLRTSVLHVRDRDSGAELSDVTLVRSPPWPRGGYPHPGEFEAARVLAGGRSSPIELPAEKQRLLDLHVHAPGHAWEHVQLDGVQGGERVVLLGSGGGLDVELEAERIDAGTLLRVYEASTLVNAESDVRDRRRLSFDGLRCGPVTLRAEIGNWWEDPLVLGSAATEIRAGERATLRLALKPPPSADSVAIGGEVVLAPEWKLEHFLLVVELLDPPLGGREPVQRILSQEMRRDEERPGVWHWRIEDRQAGRYQIVLWNLQYSVALEVPPGGQQDIRIQPPRPCEAELRTVDKQSGAPIEVEHVFWNCERSSWVHGGGAQPAEWDPRERLWRLVAPEGEIELHTNGGRTRPDRRVVTLHEGRNTIVLELEREYHLALVLSHAGKTIPWPDVVAIHRLRRSTGQEDDVWGPGRERFVVGFDSPGGWTLTLPEIPGYRKLAPIDVTIDPERDGELVIELEP